MKRMNALAALLASAVLGLSLHPGAIAQDKYPTRPLQMVVPFPPGVLQTSSPAPSPRRWKKDWASRWW